MTAPAPLDAAIEAIDRWDSLPVTHRYDYEAANVIAAFRPLLAALSADKRSCEPGVICPTCVSLERAEAALRPFADAEEVEPGTVCNRCWGEIAHEPGCPVLAANAYFQREERP